MNEGVELVFNFIVGFSYRRSDSVKLVGSSVVKLVLADNRKIQFFLEILVGIKLGCLSRKINKLLVRYGSHRTSDFAGGSEHPPYAKKFFKRKSRKNPRFIGAFSDRIESERRIYVVIIDKTHSLVGLR